MFAFVVLNVHGDGLKFEVMLLTFAHLKSHTIII